MTPTTRMYPTLERYVRLRGQMEGSPRVILPFHRRIFALIIQWAMGRLPQQARNLAVCIPPRHGKTMIAHDAVAYLTGAFPDSQWIYASYSTEMAVRQTSRIRAVMSSEWYVKVFPAACVTGNKSTQRYFETNAGGSVYGTGMDGTITGFGAGRKRACFGGGLIIDDPIKPSEARSETMRGNVNRWFTETLISRRNHDTTPILIVMQRVHDQDLVGHVLATMPDKWHVLSIPALDEATGDLLWPDTFGKESADMLREVDSATFFAQYQQSPTPPGGNMIKLGWWKTYDPTALHTGNGLIFLTADTAYKSHKNNDASVIRAWFGSREHLYALDAVHGRWEFPRLLSEARDFWEKWSALGACEFWVEDKASGTPLAQTLRDNHVPAYDWKPTDYDFPEDKAGRMQEAAWIIHGGKVLLPQGDAILRVDGRTTLLVAAHAKILAEECATFAQDMSHAHDDHCDALTMAISLWRDAGGGKDLKR